MVAVEIFLVNVIDDMTQHAPDTNRYRWTVLDNSTDVVSQVQKRKSLVITSSIETCQQLVADKLVCPIFILLETATSETIKAAFDAGADDYLLYPISENDLSRRIKLHFQESTNDELKRLQIVFEQSTTATAIFDTDMHYLGANQAWRNSYQLGDMPLIGRSHYDIFPEIGDDWKDIHQRCLKGERNQADVAPFPRQDGSMDWLEWDVRPWYHDDGRVGGLLMYTSVITERINAVHAHKEAEIRYARMIEKATDGILIIQDEHIVYANDSAQRLLLAKMDDLKNRLLWSFIAPEYLTQMQEEFNQYRNGKISTGHHEVRLLNSLDNLVEVEMSLNQTWYSGSEEIAIFMRDISERKLAEMVVEETQYRLQAQAESLITINQIAGSLHKSLDIQELAQITARVTRDYLEADTTLFYLLDSSEEYFDLIVAEGMSGEALRPFMKLPVTDSLTGVMYKEKRIVISSNVLEDERLYEGSKDILRQNNINQIIFVPVVLNQQILGAVNLGFREPKQIDDEIFTTLQSIGQTLGLALHNAQTVEQLVQEITERQQAEDALRISEERLKSVITTIPVILFSVDEDAVFIMLEGRGLEIVDLQASDFIGRSVYEAFPEGKNLQNAIEDGLAGNHGHSQLQSGNIILDLYYSPLANGKGVTALCVDVTERTRSQRLQEILFNISRATLQADTLHSLLGIVRQQLSNLLYTGNFVVALYDEDRDVYTFPYWNNTIKNYENAAQGISLKGKLTDYVRRTGQPMLVSTEEHYRLHQQGIVTTEPPYSPVWMGVPLTTQAGAIGVIVVQSYDNPDTYDLHDLELMTYIGENLARFIESKKAEEALRESEERFSKAFYNSPDSVTITRRKTGELIEINEGFERIFGYTREEAIGKSTLDLNLFALDEDRQQLTDELERTGSVRNMELTGRHKSGELRDCLISAEPLTLRGEDCLVVIVRDITDRKAAERALQKSEQTSRESKQFMELVLNTIPTRVFWKNRDLVFEGGNQVLADDLGFNSPYELIGKTDFDLSENPADAENYRRDDRTVMESGSAKIGYEEPQTRADGSVRWLETSKIPLRDEEGEVIGVLGTYSDITERKLAAEAIRKSEETSRAFQQKLAELHEISFELSNIDNLDDIYRRAVELGRSKLGYDRMGLFLIDVEADLVKGTFGTDDQGIVRDEQEVHYKLSNTGTMLKVIEEGWNTYIFENAPLYDSRQEVGKGWNGMAALRDSARSIGMIAIDNLLNRVPPRPFEQDLLTLFGTVLGYIITGKQKDNARQQMLERLQLLNNIDRAILSSISPEEISLAIIHQVNELVGSDYASIIQIDDDKKIYQLLAWTFDLDTTPSRPFSFAGNVLENDGLRKGIRYDVSDMDALETLTPAELSMYDKGIRSYSIIPLLADSELVGVVTFAINKPEKIADENLEIAQGIATQLALALRQTTLMKQVQAYASDLESLVDERTAQLTAKASELEAFTYSVSHDLRSPLRAISGFADVVIEDYEGDMDEEATHYLQRIKHNANRMGNLIDDLLHLSRVGRRDLETRIIQPESTVRAIIEELTADEQIGEAVFTINSLPECKADPILLKQLWVNLITNAIKYSRLCDSPHIIIDAETIDGEVIYSIKDNGVGFDMQYADKLFGVFQRLHTSENYEGTGIGLATVYRIVERHQGRIWADAKLDEGANFFFTLGLD